MFTDSVQTGDRLSYDATLGRFGDFNEPYYRSYIADDIAQAFIDAGLTPDTKVLASSTKVLSFRKPGPLVKMTMATVNTEAQAAVNAAPSAAPSPVAEDVIAEVVDNQATEQAAKEATAVDKEGSRGVKGKALNKEE